MSDIIDFDSIRKQMGNSSSPLFEQAAQRASDKIFRSILLLQISAEIEEKIKEVGLDPTNFEIDDESVDRFYATGTLLEDDAIMNGPWYDWHDGKMLYRVVATPVLDEEGVCPSIVDALRIGDDDDHWQMWKDGEWEDDGPPEGFFDVSADEIMALEDDLTITDLDLTPGTHGILMSAGIDSIDALKAMTDEGLLAIRGIGKARLADIRGQLTPENLEGLKHMKMVRGMMFDALFGGDDAFITDEDWDDDEDDEDWDDDVDNLEISNDTFDILTVNGIDTISQLRAMSEMELMQLPGMTKRWLKEIKEALERE